MLRLWTEECHSKRFCGMRRCYRWCLRPECICPQRGCACLQLPRRTCGRVVTSKERPGNIVVHLCDCVWFLDVWAGGTSSLRCGDLTPRNSLRPLFPISYWILGLNYFDTIRCASKTLQLRRIQRFDIHSIQGLLRYGVSRSVIQGY